MLSIYHKTKLEIFIELLIEYFWYLSKDKYQNKFNTKM